MIRRTSLFFLEFLAGLAAGSVILLVAGAWWLWSGPVALTFLTPYIEQALSPDNSAIEVEIEETVLQWAGWNRAADIRVSNVRVLDSERRVIVELPQATLGLSLQAILRGRIAPTYLEIIRPSVSVVRNADGGFAVGLAVGGKKEDGGSERENIVLEGLIAELLSEPDLSRPLGYLRRVGIVEADLMVDDRRFARIWHAPRADINLTRNAYGISMNADVDLDFDGTRSRIAGVASYTMESGMIDATLNVTKLDPAPVLRTMPQPFAQRLADLGLSVEGAIGMRMASDGAIRSIRFDLESGIGGVTGEVAVGNDGNGVSAAFDLDAFQGSALTAAFPALAPNVRIDLPVDGKVSVLGTVDGSILSLEFDLTGGAGVLELPQFYPEPMAVHKVRLRGQGADNLRQIRIEEAGVAFERGAVTARAALTQIGDDFNLRLDGSATGFTAPMLRRYWPPKLAEAARTWIVGHIPKGRVEDASVSLVARLPDGDAARAKIESLNGVLRVTEATVDYFAPLPMVRGVHADMTFTDKRFDIAISRGRLRDLRIDEGSVVITGLNVEDQDISIDLVVRGPVGSAVAVLDSKPLRFVADLGLDPSSLSGQAAARLVFDFPLTKKLRLDQVAVAAGATLRNVALQNGPFGFALRDGALELQLTGLGMTVSGDASVNGVPLEIKWRENFSPREKFQRRFSASGVVDADGRRKLRLPDLPALDGKISGQFAYTAFAGGRGEIVSRIDLAAATVDFPQLRWRKRAGVPGNLYLFATVPPDGALVVEDLRLEAADMKVGARAVIGADLQSVRMLEFRNLEFAGNKMQGRVRALQAGGFDIELMGERLDIGPYLDGADEVDAPAMAEGDPLRIRARFKEVLLGEGRLLKDVNAVLVNDGANWREVAIDARIDDAAKLAVKFVPNGEGAKLLISASNAGLTLQAANWTNRLRGGRLLVTGAQAAPGAAITGQFKLKEFNVTDAPALARVLQVLSLTGIFSALGQDGLDFVTLDGNFRYYGDVVEIKNARAFGSSLGITAEGAVYISDETADLSGTLVPAYTINSALGNIPVLGKLLTGGKNEGIFAANYVVSGKLENPRVAVNPLSALAPGFLRNLIGPDVKPLTGEDALTPSQ